MPALPIVERELRVAARNRETYWSRSGVVLGLGLLWIPAWSGTFGTTSEINTFVFNGMLWAGFSVSCLAFLFTADAISRERREGTLGLLFLSQVRVGDLLLGKIGSSGFKGLCMLAAFLPMLMIPVLAGGVTGGEALREGLVLLNTFWLSLCVGLWASARSSEAFRNIKAASVVVGVFVFMPFCYFLLSYPLRTMPWASWFGLYKEAPVITIELLSPLTTLANGRDKLYHLTSWPFWISLASVQILAWLFLLLAGVKLKRSLRRRAATPESNFRSVNYRSQKRKVNFSRQENPVARLVKFQPGIQTTLWIACIIEVLYYASSWAIFRGLISWNWPAIMPWVIWFAVSASTDALFARAGSRFFYDSKRSGHLEMLLTTPLGPRGVMGGQWSALKKLLAWPVAVALTIMLLDEDFALVMQIGQPGAYNLGWVTQCFVSWGLDIALSILGVLAVCWFGMLFALKGKSAAGIILRAAGLGTGVPALFKMLYAFGAERVTFTVASSGLWTGTIAEWLEEIIVTLYYLWLFRLARKGVIRELSGAAAARRTLFQPSRVTAHTSLQITPATDVSAS